MPFAYKTPQGFQEFHSNPYCRKCQYCGSKLHFIHINTPPWEMEMDSQKLLNEFHSLNLDPCSLEKESTVIDYCDRCGWWRIVEHTSVVSKYYQIYDFFFGCDAILKSLEVSHMQQPVDEVSQYLTARYEQRFHVHPRLFEEVVASVFRNLGYHTHVTGYHNDGGIDVILKNSSGTHIGVQVKRYRSKIKANHIRAFTGALLLNGYAKGFYVTTSSYQRGAHKTASLSTSKNIPVELINATDFYEALRLSQISAFNPKSILNMVETGTITSLTMNHLIAPRNSL